MESVLKPPQPFLFENNLANVTSGNLSKEWDNWKKSFNIYTEACELSKKDKKVQLNILLHIIGDRCREVYDQFKNKEEIKSVEDLIKIFDEVFIPKKNLTIERHMFFTRDQGELESLEQYVFELNKMAAKCEFKDLCTDLIRDRLICGLRDSSLRERLLREMDLKLSKAIDICRLAELSRAQAVNIKTENSEHHVHGVNANHEETQSQSADVHWARRNHRGYQRKPFAGHGASRGGGGGGAGGSVGTSAGGGGPLGPRPGHAFQHRGGSRSRSYQSAGLIMCQKCGGRHKKFECPAFGQQCYKCNRNNHFSRMCKAVYAVQDEGHGEAIDQVINTNNSDKWFAQLLIKNHPIKFKLDTGADVNIIPKRYLKLLSVSEGDLTNTSIKLHGYSGSKIVVIGKCYMKVNYKQNYYFLKFIVVDVGSVPILGKDACEELELIKRIMSINTNEDRVLHEFRDVFEGVGCLPGEYKIQIKENAQPVIHPPRKLPIALREQVKNKLEQMQKQGIIAKVEGPTDWVNSMTVVKKPSGDIRICLDPRDLNNAIKREHFKLPTFEEVTSRLSGATVFSTLDAKHSFWQVKLKETDLCTFNTIYGRYKFLRLPFGISSASEVFHKKLYEHLDDLEGVIQFIDDILVFGPNKEVHDQRLQAVLQRCREINIKLNKQKCKIGLSEISYLGHKISKNGISPDPLHIVAIKNMPVPSNVKDVERFLGLVTYVSSFIPNLSEQTATLRELLKKEVEWHWEERHQRCFEKIKRLLVSPPVLQYYSLDKPITISVDASKNGLGACLLQNNLPVSYASKSLTKTEQAYAQIEKELYACVFACERYYMYIYGRSDITTETDHKPLVSIINKPLANAPPRLQRMLMRLQPYAFKLVYKPGKYLFIADTLSRAVAPTVLKGKPHSETQPRDYLHFKAQVCAVSANNQLTDSHLIKIQRCTKDDNELQLLIKIIRSGWPVHKKELDKILCPYWSYRDELTVDFGIVWKGSRIVIPKCLHLEMLKTIHAGHMGLEKCKLRARKSIFWPNINSQLDNYISNCQTCLTHRKQNSKEPLINHEIPEIPWNKVGTDLFHFKNKSYILVIDYFSKYIEIEELQSLQSKEIIGKLKRIFVRHGIPQTVMTDNGPEFSSNNFRQFSIDWNFLHITSSPGYAQSNGQVERAIQTVKNLMKRTYHDDSDFHIGYLEYLNTPLSSDIPSPAELLFSRKLRSKLPRSPKLFNPRIYTNISCKLKARQVSQKQYYDKGARELKQLTIGQKVKIRNNNRWEPGVVHGIIDSRSYMIRMTTGRLLRRNRKHIIIDSMNRIDPNQSYSLSYDDIMDSSMQPSIQIQSSSSIGVPRNESTKHYTRSGREVIPPDRWTYSVEASSHPS